MAKHNPMQNRPKINQMIYRVRKDLKLTQAEVAERMGMLCDTYSKKERSGQITVEWAKAFANAVGVDAAIFAEAFTTETPDYFQDKNVFSPTGGMILVAKEPNNVIETLYGTQNGENQKTTEGGLKLTATEECIIEIFRGLPKAQRDEVFNFINKIKRSE